MNYIKYDIPNSNKSGIALILVAGILSVLTLMGIAFAYASKFLKIT